MLREPGGQLLFGMLNECLSLLVLGLNPRKCSGPDAERQVALGSIHRQARNSFLIQKSLDRAG